MEPGLVVPFGRYVLQERLAQGGMGEVFRAVAVGEHGFEKPVVVKRVLPAHAGREDLTDLFVAEAKLMTRLAHPNIVEVLDFGRGDQKDYYLVLELVDGTDLGRLMRALAAKGEPFPIPLALFIAAQVLRGLHHAHTRVTGGEGAIVHRDVSPSNVLCSAEGEVKVADFGVALVAQAGRRGHAGVAGKPGYMAPEQLDGGAVDPRADLFSVGALLQQMLTGELPFPGEGVEAQREAVRRGERRRARELRPELGEAVDAILARATAERPDDRFPDARAMAQAIERLRDEGQAIASGDDLADAVREARRALPPEGRRVIALRGGDVAAEGDEPPRELTRSTSPGDLGTFTLRLTSPPAPAARAEEGRLDAAAPEPRTERIAPSDRPLPAGLPPFALDPPPSTAEARRPAPPSSAPSRGRRRVAVAALAALGLAAAMTMAFRRRATSSAAVGAVGAIGSDVATVTRPSSPPPAVPSASPSAPVAVAPVTAASPPPRSHVHLAHLNPTSLPSAAPQPAASATPDACVGHVDFYSYGSWLISGGPTRVETPAGNVSWPCGTYHLVARSRSDPDQQKSLTITVGPQLHATVDVR